MTREEYVAKNLAASREPTMAIIVWPWASWLLGFTAIVSAVVIIVYCKEARNFSKGALAAVAVLLGVGFAFLLFGSLEIFEGNRQTKVFLIKKMAICRSKIIKLKWSQVKKVDAVMAGELTSYNDSIHYTIEFETIAGGRITCLETSDRKKIKQRVDSGHAGPLHQDVHGPGLRRVQHRGREQDYQQGQDRRTNSARESPSHLECLTFPSLHLLH
jgi:hypothetical protein